MKPINTGAIKWCAGEAASLAMEGGGVVGKSARVRYVTMMKLGRRQVMTKSDEERRGGRVVEQSRACIPLF
jgi:hypothetical protein